MQNILDFNKLAQLPDEISSLKNAIISLTDFVKNQSNSKPDSNEFLNSKQAAEYLNLSSSYLYYLTFSNSIPFYKPNGKRIFFRRTDLDNWLSQNRHSSRNEIEQQAAAYCNKQTIKRLTN